MLQLASWDDTYLTDVAVRVPLPDGGHDERNVRFILRCLPTPEYLKTAARGDHAVVRRVVAGWKADLAGEDGHPLPFSRANLRALSHTPWIARAVVDAYWERFSPRKNS